MALSLARLPIEVLDLITSSSNCHSIAKLWISGSTDMRRKLSLGGVTYLNLVFTWRKKERLFPAFVRHLTQLQHLSWVVPKSALPSEPFELNIADLPTSIHSLRLKGRIEIVSDETLGSRLPHLQSFVADNSTILQPHVTSLLPQITQLHATLELILGVLPELPPTLTDLHLDIISNGQSPNSDSESAFITLKSLTSLTKLSGDVLYCIPFSELPATLTSLSIPPDLDIYRPGSPVTHLPASLLHLEFSYHKCGSMKQRLAVLPRSLTQLRINAFEGPDFYDFSEYLPADFSGALPPHLERFEWKNACTPADTLKYAPPTLTDLDCILMYGDNPY